MTELKCRNLYLLQALSYSEIASQTGLTSWQVNGLVQRRGWVRERQRREARVRESADARTRETLDTVQSALAEQCEEIAFAGLTRAREATESSSEMAAKDFQSWAGGIRALSQVARTARGLDGEQASSATQVNVYLAQGERVLAPIKTAAPVIELPTTSVIVANKPAS